MKYVLCVLFLMASACGKTPLPCMGYYDPAQGRIVALSGDWRDAGTAQIYHIQESCEIFSNPAVTCNTKGFVHPTLDRVTITSSTAIAGCMPVGTYPCTFTVGALNMTMACAGFSASFTK